MPSNALAPHRLVLLIDGENLDSKYAKAIRAQVAELGTMIEGRVYGSPTSGRMTGWKRNPDAKGLKMVDVPVTSKKKNIADFRLVVDAMELLCTGKLDALCIGSSDGDFSALATKIKERSLPVYGFGVKQTPEIYKNICDDFFDCANLRPVKDTTTKPQLKLNPASKAKTKPVAAAPQARKAQPKPQPQSASAASREIPMHIAQAVRKVVRAHEGRASFRDIGNALPAMVAKFKSNAHGFNTTKAMLKALHGKHGLEVTNDSHVVLAFV